MGGGGKCYLPVPEKQLIFLALTYLYVLIKVCNFRLAFSWKLLYRHAAQLYVQSVRDDIKRQQLKQVLRFVAAIQVKLIAQGQNVPTKRKIKYSLGNYDNIVLK